MGPEWRTHILTHFAEPTHRLTLVADPDRLLLDGELLVAIRANGFELLTYDDPVALRCDYESRYRQRWDDGQQTERSLVVRTSCGSLVSLPYDLLARGRRLAFSLAQLFPKLSYPVIRDLDPALLQPLHEAYERYTGSPMGNRATARFVLRHALGIEPDAAHTRADLLELLLLRHAQATPLPSRVESLMLDMLQSSSAAVGWPLETLLSSADAFYGYLQEEWGRYVAAQQPPEAQVKETGVAYAAGDVLPFEEPEIRGHVASLFLTGRLRPFSLPDGWRAPGWVQVGVEADDPEDRIRRFDDLLAPLQSEQPANDAHHREWIRYGERWATLTVLRHRLDADLGDERRFRYRALHLEVERRFAEWMHLRYHTLHSLPPVPQPAMVHHVPHWMAVRRGGDGEARQALVVVDGLSLSDWRVIRDAWSDEGRTWTLREGAVFAWVPTLTSLSRQALFAGTPPSQFPASWSDTGRDADRWAPFWHDHGLHPAQVGYARNLGIATLAESGGFALDREERIEEHVHSLIQSPHMQALGLVVNTVDHIMHGMQLGTAGMHEQLRLWIHQVRYLCTLIEQLLAASFSVFLTSDHGNVWARGIGRPSEGVLVEARGARARIYADPAFLALAKQQAPSASEWTNVGLPEGLQVLLAPGLGAFLNPAEQAMSHGGIALEEVILPLVEIAQE